MSKLTRKLTAMFSAVAMMASLALPAWAADDLGSVETEQIDIQPYFEKARDEFYAKSRMARANGETVEPMYTTVVDQDGNEYDLQVFELDEAITPQEDDADGAQAKTVLYSLDRDYMQPRDLSISSADTVPSGGVYGYVTVSYVTRGSSSDRTLEYKMTRIAGGWQIPSGKAYTVEDRSIQYMAITPSSAYPTIQKEIPNAPMSFNMPITTFGYYPSYGYSVTMFGATRATVRLNNSSWSLEPRAMVINNGI